MSPDEVEAIQRRLERSWSLQTSSRWTAESPARGQCSVTAIVVQRKFGGEILKTRTPGGLHFYNRLDGERLDFTAAQLHAPIDYDDDHSSAAEALADTSDRQVSALEQALKEAR